MLTIMAVSALAASSLGIAWVFRHRRERARDDPAARAKLVSKLRAELEQVPPALREEPLRAAFERLASEELWEEITALASSYPIAHQSVAGQWMRALIALAHLHLGDDKKAKESLQNVPFRTDWVRSIEAFRRALLGREDAEILLNEISEQAPIAAKIHADAARLHLLAARDPIEARREISALLEQAPALLHLLRSPRGPASAIAGAVVSPGVSPFR